MSILPKFIYKSNSSVKEFCTCIKCGKCKDKYVKQYGFFVIYKNDKINTGCESAIRILQEFIFINEKANLEGLCIDCLEFDIAVYSNYFRCFHCRMFIKKAAHSSENGLCISNKHPEKRCCLKCAKDNYIQIFEF